MKQPNKGNVSFQLSYSSTLLISFHWGLPVHFMDLAGCVIINLPRTVISCHVYKHNSSHESALFSVGFFTCLYSKQGRLLYRLNFASFTFSEGNDN